MDECIRVVIASSQRMVGEAFMLAIEHKAGDIISVIGLAADAENSIDLFKKNEVDVLIVDSNILLTFGKEQLSACRDGSSREVKIIVLVDSIKNESFEVVSLKGLDGYILKDSNLDELVKAIKDVYSGEKYYDLRLRHIEYKVDESIEKENKVNLDELLTKREKEILILLTTGLFNKEIAYKLSISEKTVKNHISNIFKKTGVSDRTQAAVYAIKNGLVSV